MAVIQDTDMSDLRLEILDFEDDRCTDVTGLPYVQSWKYWKFFEAKFW